MPRRKPRICYRLRSPLEDGDTQPRREAFAWLEAEYGDQLAPLQVTGDARLGMRVERTLLATPGLRETLEPTTTGRELAAAMARSSMAPFEPELVEGAEILPRREPPGETPEELVAMIARSLVQMLATLPIEPLSVRSYEGQHRPDALAVYAFWWPFWRSHQPSAEAAAHALATQLADDVATDLPFVLDRRIELDQEDRRNGRTPRGPGLLRGRLDEASWLIVAKELVAFFDGLVPGTPPISLLHELQRRVAALGLVERGVVRYRLREPADVGATADRQAVEVSLEASYGDELADLAVAGEPGPVARVEAALRSSSARWGRELGRRTTPRDLAVVMTDQVMRRFEPELLEGEIVLGRRQPPALALEELDRSLAARLVELALTPAEPREPASTDGRPAAERFERLIFEWRFSPLDAMNTDAAVERLAALLRDAAAVHAASNQVSWRRAARVIVDLFDANAYRPAAPTTVLHDLQGRIAALCLQADRSAVHYRLRSPWNDPEPHHVAFASLEVEYGDQPAPLRISGSPDLAARIERGLLSSAGTETTALELAAAIRLPHMRPFVPELLAGAEILPRRQALAKGQLLIADGQVWTPSAWAFGAVLDRVAAMLGEPDPLRRRLETIRAAGVGELRGLTPAQQATLLEAAHAAFVRLVRVWRAGFRDDGHDELVEHSGHLLTLLEAQVPAPPEAWSVRRLQAFGGAIDVGFPLQLHRVVAPLLADDDDPRLEQVLRKLLELDEQRSALVAAALLPPARHAAFVRDSASHRREDIRALLFEVLAGSRDLPDPGSLVATSRLPLDTVDAIIGLGVWDEAPRVRQRALAYAHGMGRIENLARPHWLAAPLAQTVLADVAEHDGVRLLVEELLRRRAWIFEIMQHEPGHWRSAVAERLYERPTWQAFTVHEAPPLASGPRSTVISRHAEWNVLRDPGFARALSARSGGFALALEQRLVAGTRAVDVWCAGRPVESTMFPDDDSSLAGFCELFEAIADGYPSAFTHPEVAASTWFVSLPSDDEPAPDIAAPPLSRAMLVRTDAAGVRAAAAATPPPGRVRLLERRTRVTDETCVLLEAEPGAALDHAWLTALARRLDVFALALHLPGPDQDFTWTLVDAGGGEVRTGTGRGAVELARRCQNVTSLLGEPPAILRWPRDAPGELLRGADEL